MGLRNLFTRLRPEPTPNPEAVQAIEDAQRSLLVAVARDREVRRIAADLRTHREINHFAERIKASMREA